MLGAQIIYNKITLGGKIELNGTPAVFYNFDW